jgi:hypothetical protein
MTDVSLADDLAISDSSAAETPSRDKGESSSSLAYKKRVAELLDSKGLSDALEIYSDRDEALRGQASRAPRLSRQR